MPRTNAITTSQICGSASRLSIEHECLLYALNSHSGFVFKELAIPVFQVIWLQLYLVLPVVLFLVTPCPLFSVTEMRFHDRQNAI